MDWNKLVIERGHRPLPILNRRLFMRKIEIMDVERRENTVFVHCKVQGDIDNILIEENESYKAVEDAIFGSTEKLINKV